VRKKCSSKLASIAWPIYPNTLNKSKSTDGTNTYEIDASSWLLGSGVDCGSGESWAYIRWAPHPNNNSPTTVILSPSSDLIMSLTTWNNCWEVADPISWWNQDTIIGLFLWFWVYSDIRAVDCSSATSSYYSTLAGAYWSIRAGSFILVPVEKNVDGSLYQGLLHAAVIQTRGVASA